MINLLHYDQKEENKNCKMELVTIMNGASSPKNEVFIFHIVFPIP